MKAFYGLLTWKEDLAVNLSEATVSECGRPVVDVSRCCLTQGCALDLLISLKWNTSLKQLISEMDPFPSGIQFIQNLNQISNYFVIMSLLIHPSSPQCHCKIHLEFNSNLIICSLLVSVSLGNTSAGSRFVSIDNTHPRLEHNKLTQDLFTVGEGYVLGLALYNTLVPCCHRVYLQLRQALQQHVHHFELQQVNLSSGVGQVLLQGTCAMEKSTCTNWLFQTVFSSFFLFSKLLNFSIFQHLVFKFSFSPLCPYSLFSCLFLCL